MSECQTKAGNQECFEKLEKLFIDENSNVFFRTSAASPPSPVSLDVIELVPS